MDQDQTNQPQLGTEPPVNPLPEIQAVPQVPVVPEQPKNSKKKRILLIIAVVLLVAAGAAAYWLLRADKEPQKAAVTNETTQTAEQIKELPDRFNFQVGSKIASYDPASKKQETYTSSLPLGADVIDFYANSATWRAYYSTTDQEGSVYSYWYLEKGAEPQKIATAEFSYATANAKQQIFAYTEIFNLEQNATADKKVNRTYVVQNGKTDEVWRSKQGLTDVPKTDLLSSLYYVNGISGDGSKLLFSSVRCFYCDGGGTPTSFELTLADKSTKVIVTSNMQGGIKYDDDGKSFLASETDDSALGGPTGPADVKVTRYSAPGATGEVVLSASSTKWDSVSYSEDLSTIFGTKVVDQTSYKQSVEGYYRVGVEDSLTKLTITGLSNDLIPGNISKIINNCQLLILSDYSSQTNSTYEVGVMCGQGTSQTYTKLDGLSWEANTKFQRVSLL